MKGKFSTKAIVLTVLTVVLLGAGVTGTVLFLKDNGETAAITENNQTEQTGQDVALPVTGDEVEGTETQNDDEALNNDQGESVSNVDAAQGNTGTGTATATTVNTGTGTGTTTTDQDVPNEDYTQTVEQTKTEVVEEPWYTRSVGWVPQTLELDVNDIRLNKADMEIRKTATVNDDNYVTTVFQNDVITYRIYVRNNGKTNLEGIHINDTVPAGTVLVDGSIDNEGTISQDGEITWIKDIKSGEEIIVSYKVKVLLGTDTEGRVITQIDNTAKVNEEDTNTTHNPTITYSKEVKVIAKNGQELDNQIVIPGTRLRYYITLTNSTAYDGVTRVTDTIPEGTSLINGTISNGGEVKENNNIVWEKVNVPAGESVKVYFDVTVNNNRKTTVSNVAKIGAEKEVDPNAPAGTQQEQYTNTVKTPVFTASKVSAMDYNSGTQTPKLHETNEVTYVVTIKNSASTNNADVSQLAGTAKLQDEFWTEDLNKMTFKEVTLVITDENGSEVPTQSVDESFLANISVTLNAGETATLTYKYTINPMQNPSVINNTANKIEWDEISNNLYWAEPGESDPERPQNPNDTTNYFDTQNQNDPTPPTADPQNSNKPGLIDTVVIRVEEESIDIEAIKEWIDYNNQYGKRPDSVSFTLYRVGETTGIKTVNLSASDNWRVIFSNLRKTDANGTAYEYYISENKVDFYKLAANGRLGTNNTITIKNYLDQLFIAEKKSPQNGNTIEEKGEINYTITVYNISSCNEDGTTDATTAKTAIKDVYKDNDANKLEFKNGVIEYYTSLQGGTPISEIELYKTDLENKIVLDIPANGRAVIKYNCTAKVIDENKTPDADGIIRDSITNYLFWDKVNDNDADPRYPIGEYITGEDPKNVISEVNVKLKKEYTEILATKIWDDETDKSNRPSEITFTLQKNGEATNITKTLSANDAIATNPDKWQVTFDKLIKYDANGREYSYTIKENDIPHYIARYSDDKRTVTNMIGENIQAQVITSNANLPEVPMDVVFVLDISSSMLKDPVDINKRTNDKTNKIDTAKIITMVESVNKAIDKVLKSNSENRIAVQLYNSKVEKSGTGYDYYLIDLNIYEPRDDGEYIKFNWTSHREYADWLYMWRYDGELSTTVNSKKCRVAIIDDTLVGTYTQAGIQRGEAILKDASNKKVEGENFTRIPVFILVTDGDPTHYNSTSVGQYNEDGTPKIIPSNGQGTYPTSGSRIAREKFTSAEYYYYTMKQLEASKASISSAYSVNSSLPRECRVYTIGIGLSGSMAEVLLNPDFSYINDNEGLGLVSETINPNITNEGNHTGYNTSNLTGKAFYQQQQNRLRSMLNGETVDGTNFAKLNGNYTEKSINIKNKTDETLLQQLDNAFVAVIEDAGESIENRTIGEDRRIDLTDIAVDRRFEITITGTDYNDSTISINKSYETFNAALGDSTVNKYIKGSYYIDLSTLKTGSVTVTYVKDN